jgi:hypothetical protein
MASRTDQYKAVPDSVLKSKPFPNMEDDTY